jgi:hypothetical protein
MSSLCYWLPDLPLPARCRLTVCMILGPPMGLSSQPCNYFLRFSLFVTFVPRKGRCQHAFRV